MSEYWKSTPKYYCKHCKTFVVDTPLSKKNHDASPKHQGALKRFLRDLHRTTEREATAATAAKREVARLNALVSGPAPSSSSSSSSSAPQQHTRPRPPTEDERKRQLKELEALGVALPDEARRELAMVGEWTTAAAARLAQDPLPPAAATEKEALQALLLKRKFEEEEKERRWNAMDDDERELRGFSIQTKAYPPATAAGGGTARAGGFRPMVFKGKGKAVEAKEEEEDRVPVKSEEKEEEPRIKREETDEDVEAAGVKKELPDVKKEVPEVKKEDVGDGIVFKKRKVKNIRKKI